MTDNNEIERGEFGPNREVNDFHKYVKPKKLQYSQYLGEKYTFDTTTWRKCGEILTRKHDGPSGYLIVTYELCEAEGDIRGHNEGDTRYHEYYYESTLDEAVALMWKMIGEYSA